MSDTDEEFLPNSFHKFPYEKSGIHGTYGNRMISKFNQPNHGLGFDQRSMYSMRATSPISLQSFPNSRIQQSYSRGPMSSQGSVYNARCRSPMSVRSIDSNVSVSAADIALAFKTTKYNKHECRIIQEAYKAYMKNHKRRRIGKKRNLKSFMKYCRRQSGGESGDEGSDSSVSSDDCRSTRSAFYTASRPRVRCRPPKMDLKEFTTQMKQNDIYQDCTENFKQNSFRNLLSANNRTQHNNHSFMPHQNQQSVRINHTHTGMEPSKEHCFDQNLPSVTLKDRLAKDNTTLLPFQRFNKSGVNLMYGTSYKIKTGTFQHTDSTSNRRYEDSDNESHEIFDLTENHTLQKKRFLENDRKKEDLPVRKRKKLSTSPDNQDKQKSVTKNNDFNFKKPQLPVRKIGPVAKSNEPEILISKSSQPLDGNLYHIPLQLIEKPQTVDNEDDKKDSTQVNKPLTQNHIDSMNSNGDTTNNSTDVSMKPSFIKRKLFTQKLHIAENVNNISSENLNSPQTKVLRTCREKNKVRKFTSQSCLNRDILGDSNYLDLIHKIVPPEQMKKQNNNKEAKKNSLDKEGKWDVTLAVSTSKIDTKSDTYTDEEIFNVPEEKKKKATNKTEKGSKTDVSVKKKSQVTPNCKVVVHKLPETLKDISEPREECPKKRTVMSCVKSFWETDFESDMEDVTNISSKRTAQGAPQLIKSNLFKLSPKKLSTNQSIRSCRLKNNSVTNMARNLHADKENNNDSNILSGHTQTHSNNKETPEFINSKALKTKTAILPVTSPEKQTMNQSTRSIRTKNLNGKSRTLIDLHADIENNFDNNMLNRSFRSWSKNKEAPLFIDNNSNDLKSRCTVSETSPEKRTMNLSMRSCRMKNLSGRNNTLNNLHAYRENNNENIPNRSSRSCSKNKEINNKTDANRLKKKSDSESKPRNQKNKEHGKPKEKIPSKKNKEQPQSIFNISRESLRLKQKRQSIDNSSPNGYNQKNKPVLNKLLNTSRESIRLKQKREANLSCKENVANKK